MTATKYIELKMQCSETKRQSTIKDNIKHRMTNDKDDNSIGVAREDFTDFTKASSEENTQLA